MKQGVFHVKQGRGEGKAAMMKSEKLLADFLYTFA